MADLKLYHHYQTKCPKLTIFYLSHQPSDMSLAIRPTTVYHQGTQRIVPIWRFLICYQAFAFNPNNLFKYQSILLQYAQIFICQEQTAFQFFLRVSRHPYLLFLCPLVCPPSLVVEFAFHDFREAMVSLTTKDIT